MRLMHKFDGQEKLTFDQLVYMHDQPVLVYYQDRLWSSGSVIADAFTHELGKRVVLSRDNRIHEIDFDEYEFYAAEVDDTMNVAWDANAMDATENYSCYICNNTPTKYDLKNVAWLCKDHYAHPNAQDMIMSRLHDNDQIDTNEAGGKQSHLEYAFELIEPEFSKRMAHVLWTGMQKYGARNWQSIPHDVNIGRAIYHLTQALEGTDQSEDHYANAACRVMFAMLTDKHE